MTSPIRHLLPALLLAAVPLAAQSPAAPSAVLVFHFEHPGLPVPDYTLTLHEDGSGTYAATYAPAPSSGSYSSQSTMSPAGSSTPTSRPVTVSHATTARLFDKVRSTNRLQSGCESRQKNIANTGAKTISYTGPDGSGACTFNYTENKAVASVSETFQAIAQTLDEGRSLDLKHRYDRLGLDRELAVLAEAVHDGRAVEVATIAPVLESLMNDTQVMERVRKRAAGLLEASANTR
jgi:hypothetical protein